MSTEHHAEQQHTTHPESHSSQSSQEIDLAQVAERMKKLPPWTGIALILIAIVLFGGYLRFYHIDYPMVGYHNWKEAHYATEARNFAREGFFKWGFFLPYFDIHQGADGDDGQHPDSFPLTSIVIALLFNIFGTSLFIARLPSVLMSCGTIIALFFLVKKLFGRNDLALTASALFAMMPLTIFFGRQIQLEPYAQFFMVLSGYFYLRWLDNYETKWMWIASSTFVMGFLARYDHFTIAFAMLFLFPWTKLKEKQFAIKTIIAAVVPLIPVLGWQQYMKWYGGATSQPSIPLPILQISSFFNPEWWPAVDSYIRDNFTYLGLSIAFIGAVITVLFFLSNRHHKGYRFTLGYIIGGLIWIPVAVNYLEGHAYHQYPVTSLIALLQSIAIVTTITTLIGYAKSYVGTMQQVQQGIRIGIGVAALFVAYLCYGQIISYHGFWGTTVLFILLIFSAMTSLLSIVGSAEQFVRSSIFKTIFTVAALYFLMTGFASYEGTKSATNRVFDTQFPGLDIAGDYIREHSAGREERIMHTSGQGYGLMWHADRRGHKLPSKPSDINKLEEKGARWIFIYQWGFDKFQDENFTNYVSGNYSLRQIAFVNSQQGNRPLYFLFEKGGSSNMSAINEWMQGKAVNTRYYEYTSGAKFPVAFTV